MAPESTNAAGNDPKPGPITCAGCGAAFACGMTAAGGVPCWCADLPAAMPIPLSGSGVQCLCRSCLLLKLRGPAPG